MNQEDKNLSLQFYNYLSDIIGSKEVVRTRREIFTEKDIVQSTTLLTSISSGSKAEGLDLEGSDYDQMCVLNHFRVYESLNDDKYNLDRILLVMDTNDTKPGFTKLKLVNKLWLDIDTIHECSENVGEETYISSKSVREQNLVDGMIIHGPCHSTANGDYDSATCLRCNEWIIPAQQWIYRSRTCWPHDTLVTSSLQYGVLFVPIGCKHSPNEDLQWRISFSLTEKLLIYSFSHAQLLCYALLKILLKDIIKAKHGDLLCSYFLKTIMFWLSEDISPSEWKPDNMCFCVLECIRRLIYCVEYKTCLHYFIPENNLFEDRFTKDDHQALLDTLRIVYGSPWTSIFHTKTFLNYKLQSVNSHYVTISASALSCFSYVRVIHNPRSIYSKFKRFVSGYNSLFRKDMCTYVLCVCSRMSMQSSDFYNLADKNKTFYKRYKQMFGLLKISLETAQITSWSLIASLFYNCKRFLECLDIINYCLISCTPDKIYLHYANSLAEQTVFKQMTQKMGLLHAFKYLIIENVCFLYPFCLLPNELISLIKFDQLHIPPVVYSYLLQFLCCHQLQDYRGKHNALHNLKLTIQNRYLIFPNENILRILIKCLKIVRALL